MRSTTARFKAWRAGFAFALGALVLSPAAMLGLEEIDPQLIAVSAGEVSVLAAAIGETASDDGSNTEAITAFQDLADQASAMLQEIATLSVAGGGRDVTRPLFEQTARVILRAMRIARGAGIQIDRVVAEEFGHQLDELEKFYYPGPSDSGPS